MAGLEIPNTSAGRLKEAANDANGPEGQGGLATDSIERTRRAARPYLRSGRAGYIGRTRGAARPYLDPAAICG